MRPVVGYELGVPIYCDEAGTFSASVNGRTMFEKSITKVRKAIRAAAITVTLMQRDKHARLGAFSPVDIAIVRETSRGIVGTMAAETNHYAAREYGSLYEYDKEILDELAATDKHINDQIRDLERMRMDIYDQVEIARAKPITVERFNELLEEKRVERAANPDKR